MTETELFTELKSLGLPVVYGEFSTPQTPPFITYQFTNAEDINADNQNFVEISNFQVELYTTKKSPATEKLLQDKFKTLKLPYDKFETYIDTEQLRQVVYQIKLIGG
jgi:hypothetical protein